MSTGRPARPARVEKETGTLRTLTLLGAIGMIVLVLMGVGNGAAADRLIRVTPLAREGQVLVSFEIHGAVSDELQRSIQSGLPTTFSYDVDLRQSSPLWFDRSVGFARIQATVRFDNLTGRYHVSLMQDGRVADARTTDDAGMVRQWVSAFHRLPLFSTRDLRANAEYSVQVRGRTRPRNAWFFLPWDRPSAAGSAKFTLLR